MDSNLFSLKYSYHYITSTVPVSDIGNGLYIACSRFTKALLETSVALLSILFYMCIFVAKLLTLVFPHAVNLTKAVYEFHRTKLTRSDIMIEIAVVSVVLVFLIFKKRILKFWSDIENFISKKSKAAAQAAPHVLFFGASFVLSIVGKRFIMPLTSASIMPLFTLIIPLLTTSRVIYRSQNNVNNKNLSESYNHKILLWVILAIYHALVTLLSLVPFSQRLLGYLPYLKELIIVVLSWVQLSPAFTAIVFTSVVTPILKKISTVLPSTGSFEAQVQQSGTVFRFLKMMRMLTDAQEAFLRSLLQDSVATLIALCFIFTPNPIASVGMVTVALLLPAFRTAASASPLVRAKVVTARSLESDHDYLPSSVALHRQWLDYWVCVGALWCVRIYGMSFWPSVMMLVTLWLQHSYFLGASKVIRLSYENMCMMVDRNAETQRQRQMERLEREQAEAMEHTPRGGDSEGEPLLGTTSPAKAVLIREEEEGTGEDQEKKIVPAKDVETIHTRKENRKGGGGHKATSSLETTTVAEGPFSAPVVHHSKIELKTSARKAKGSGHKTRSGDKKHKDDDEGGGGEEEEDYISIHTAVAVTPSKEDGEKYAKKDM